MVEVYTEETIAIPAGITVSVEARIVTVTGKHGSITREFKHLPIDCEVVGNNITVAIWNANSRAKACVRTFCTHLNNMFLGVTQKYQYKMRLVYSHFPINVNTVEGGKVAEIRHFLGEKRTRTIRFPEGVLCEKSTAVKDELIVTGIDVEKVGKSCALLRQNALVRNKDIRQFLDGIYVSEKGFVESVSA